MKHTTIAFFVSSLINSQGFNPTNTSLKQLETILESASRSSRVVMVEDFTGLN